MIGVCQANRAEGFVSSTLNYIDCQTQAIGAGGFQALAAPGSAVSLLFTGLLTIFIALYGYRLLLGETLGLRDGVLAAAKIGIVLALAFSWPVYRTLIYDVTLKAPAEFAGAIGRPVALPGAEGGLVARLDRVDRAFVALGELGSGGGLTAPIGDAETRQTVSAYDPLALGAARIGYLLGAMGALAAMRMIAGVLLALGPLFVAFLLFEGTRGLFEGWLHALVGSALGALGTAVLLGVELAFLEPRLAQLIAWRSAGYAIPGAAVELLVISLVFALATAALLIAAWRVTAGFGLPASLRRARGQLIDAIGRSEANAPTTSRPASSPLERSRAALVADALIVSQQREAARSATGYERAARRAEPHANSREAPEPSGYRPLGQSYPRRPRGRVSASATRRDTGQ